MKLIIASNILWVASALNSRLTFPIARGIKRFNLFSHHPDQHQGGTTIALQNQADAFAGAFRNSLKGDRNQLESLLKGNSECKAPFVSSGNELLEALEKFAGFFTEPSFTVFSTKQVDTNTINLECQLSFWYPIFWRPRIIVPGTISIQLDESRSTIKRMTAKSALSLSTILFDQFLPRFWDLYHLWSSPSPERPPVRKLGNPLPTPTKLIILNFIIPHHTTRLLTRRCIVCQSLRIATRRIIWPCEFPGGFAVGVRGGVMGRGSRVPWSPSQRHAWVHPLRGHTHVQAQEGLVLHCASRGGQLGTRRVPRYR